MGEFKGIMTDPTENWEPDVADFTLMQLSATRGHVSALKDFIAERSDRKKYYGEPFTDSDFEFVLGLIGDMEKTLE